MPGRNFFPHTPCEEFHNIKNSFPVYHNVRNFLCYEIPQHPVMEQKFLKKILYNENNGNYNSSNIDPGFII